jgi:hypothetical protein
MSEGCPGSPCQIMLGELEKTKTKSKGRVGSEIGSAWFEVSGQYRDSPVCVSDPTLQIVPYFHESQSLCDHQQMVGPRNSAVLA